MSAPASSNPLAADSTDWDAYQTAVARLEARIAERGPADTSLAAVQARAAAKLARLRSFLPWVGSPAARLPVVHVTGTSGKGSTAAAIAALLAAAGRRTGLVTSPYLQVATEKLQVDGRLVAGRTLLAEVEALEAAERRWRQRTGAGPLSHGEAWVALALSSFVRQGVEIAVVEVGAGGRLDPTNVVAPIACVLTNVGLDHVASLGPTLEAIAWQKAGIFKPGAVALTAEPPGAPLAVVAAEAARVGIPLLHPADVVPFRAEPDTPPFMAANHHLALATVVAVAERGWLDPARIDPTALAAARLPARFEAMPTIAGPPVVLDGAHNAAKIAALVRAAEGWRRVRALPPPVAVVGVLAAKDVADVAGPLLQMANVLICTSAGVTGKPAMDARALAARLAALAGMVPISAVPDPAAALAVAGQLAEARNSWVLATGSLFVAGALRRRWYADRAIVEQRTPWPHPGPAAGTPPP